ncbi:hypothetical protein H0A58_11015 [Alcaligenaceae bacterium]|nr:hypothetical protein [Alcaligenaceae bacterium]
MLVPHGDRFGCKDNMCLVTVKFDDGKINEYLLMLRRWQDAIGPHFDRAEFLGSIGLASRVIIEVPLAKGGRREFAFNVSDLPIKVIPKPAKVLSVPFGSSLADFKNLGEKRIGMSGEECYKIENKDLLALDGVEGIGSVCFFQGKFYAAVLETSSVKEDNSSTAIKAHLDKVFETEAQIPNPIKDFESWPGIGDDDGTHTKSAGAYLNDGATVFVIKDNVILPLQPEAQ